MTLEELTGTWAGDASADGLPDNKVKITIEQTPDPLRVVWTSRLISMEGAPVICNTLCSVSVAILSIEEHVKAGFVKEV